MEKGMDALSFRSLRLIQALEARLSKPSDLRRPAVA